MGPRKPETGTLPSLFRGSVFVMLPGEEHTMRRLLATGTVIAFALAFATGALVAEDKTPPEKITYEAKPGPVTFDHPKHVEAVKRGQEVLRRVSCGRRDVVREEGQLSEVSREEACVGSQEGHRPG